jgi:peptidoglycan/xylan/chitin deacetylase (PgdA/CDA1 family)
MKPKILIISLHRVGWPPVGATHRGLFITPRLLSFELWLLSKLGYKFNTLKDAILASGGKHAVITFDDGYEDNLAAGFPVLDKHSVPATIFVVTKDVGRKEVVWDEAGEKLPANMLGWEELAELQRKGWEIGSHGAEHVRFHERTVAQQERLVSSSLDMIETKLGTVPISFAYPYGYFNEDTKAVLRQSGIRFAVTTAWPEPADLLERDDLLGLKRIPIGGRNFHHFVQAAIRTFRAIGIADVMLGLVPKAIGSSLRIGLTKSQSPALTRQNKM